MLAQKEEKVGSTGRVLGTSWDGSPWSPPFEQCCTPWRDCNSDLLCSLDKSIGSFSSATHCCCGPKIKSILMCHTMIKLHLFKQCSQYKMIKRLHSCAHI